MSSLFKSCEQIGDFGRESFKSGEEMGQNIIEKLRTTNAQFRTLSDIEQFILMDALSKGRSNVLRLCPAGEWHPMHCDRLEEDRRYRLSMDYSVPGEVYVVGVPAEHGTPCIIDLRPTVCPEDLVISINGEVIYDGR